MIRKYLTALFVSALMPFAACQAQAAPMEKSLTPEIGGIKQFIDIKTDDTSKPVLLFLSGGPGSSMIRNADAFTQLLKTRFTIVQWD